MLLVGWLLPPAAQASQPAGSRRLNLLPMCGSLCLGRSQRGHRPKQLVLAEPEYPTAVGTNRLQSVQASRRTQYPALSSGNGATRGVFCQMWPRSSLHILWVKVLPRMRSSRGRSLVDKIVSISRTKIRQYFSVGMMGADESAPIYLVVVTLQVFPGG